MTAPALCAREDWTKIVIQGVELEVDYIYSPPTVTEGAIIDVERVRTVSGDEITDLLTEGQFAAIREKIIQEGM